MTQEPKLWKDMTPEEKGALLLAHHEGKVIEWNSTHAPGDWGDWGACGEDCLWDGEWGGDGFAYRVKPEPEREKVTARICLTGDGSSLHMDAEYGYDNYGKDHLYATVTFDVIDGKPDPASLKIKEVG
jgi:hypothetical protein